jgi:AraC-like DNA-binding protein
MQSSLQAITVSHAFAHVQSRIAALMMRLTPTEGINHTAIPGLTLLRITRSNEPQHGIMPPVFCMCAQGRKGFSLLEESYIYDPGHYMVSAVDLPVVGYSRDASPEAPYLGLVLQLDINELYPLLLEDRMPPASRPAGRGLAVSRMDEPLLESVLRLLQLLERPRDLPVLVPLALRELYYYLLMGDQAHQLHALASANSQTRRVAEAISWLKQHYAESVSVEAIARVAHMSPSGLHHHFKVVTGMSPLQFQKRLRLQESRRLMLHEGLDAANASFRVGYESPTQFSREYSRQFGDPPFRDISRLRDLQPAWGTTE